MSKGKDGNIRVSGGGGTWKATVTLQSKQGEHRLETRARSQVPMNVNPRVSTSEHTITHTQSAQADLRDGGTRPVPAEPPAVVAALQSVCLNLALAEGRQPVRAPAHTCMHAFAILPTDITGRLEPDTLLELEKKVRHLLMQACTCILARAHHWLAGDISTASEQGCLQRIKS
eukprot:1141877-Pelagomonas_calceolata.AAC.1